ncbi:MAG: hypothetical protein K2L18_06575, partial [Acetatifactor sp.]|nr:hypothetical protein [Acetatifactor sp.]
IPVVSPIVKMDWLNTWIYKLSMNMLVGYLGYFLLGYYLRKYPCSKKKCLLLYIGGLVGFLYTAIGTIVQSYMQDAYYDTLFSPGSWNILLFAIAVFTFFANGDKINFGYPFVRKVARYSFVIYMIHPFFLEKLNMVGVTTTSFHSLFSIPALTILIFLCSYAVAAVINRIPYLNKLVV